MYGSVLPEAWCGLATGVVDVTVGVTTGGDTGVVGVVVAVVMVVTVFVGFGRGFDACFFGVGAVTPASGSVYWLSPADGPESAIATAGTLQAALAATASAVLHTRWLLTRSSIAPPRFPSTG